MHKLCNLVFRVMGRIDGFLDRWMFRLAGVNVMIENTKTSAFIDP